MDAWITQRANEIAQRFNAAFEGLCEDDACNEALHNCVADLRYWWTVELCSVYLEVVKHRLRNGEVQSNWTEHPIKGIRYPVIQTTPRRHVGWLALYLAGRQMRILFFNYWILRALVNSLLIWFFKNQNLRRLIFWSRTSCMVSAFFILSCRISQKHSGRAFYLASGQYFKKTSLGYAI